MPDNELTESHKLIKASWPSTINLSTSVNTIEKVKTSKTHKKLNTVSKRKTKERRQRERKRSIYTGEINREQTTHLNFPYSIVFNKQNYTTS